MKKKSLIALIIGLSILSMYGCSDKAELQKNLPIVEDNVQEDTEKPVQPEVEKPAIEKPKSEEEKVTEEKSEDKKEAESVIAENRIYYHEGFTGNNYYTVTTLSGDNESKVNEIIKALKVMPENDYLEDVRYQEFTPLPEDVLINSVKVEKDRVLIDFNKNFTDGLGSSSEKCIVDSMVNSIGYNFNVDSVHITFNGENYSSGHVIKEDGEGFDVNLSKEIKLNKK